MTIEQLAWAGMVPVDDTALAVTDTGGPGRPVVYLNGSVRRPVALAARHRRTRQRATGTSPTTSGPAAGRSARRTTRSRRASATSTPSSRPGAWTGRSWSAGPTARCSRCTGPPGTRTASWGWCRSTARTRTTGSTTPPADRSGSSSAGCSPMFPIARPLGLAARMTRRAARRDQHRDQRALRRPRPGPRPRDRPGPVRGRHGWQPRRPTRS